MTKRKTFGVMVVVLMAIVGSAVAGNVIVCTAPPGTAGCRLVLTADGTACDIDILIPASTSLNCQAYALLKTTLNEQGCCVTAPPPPPPGYGTWGCGSADPGICLAPTNDCVPANFMTGTGNSCSCTPQDTCS